MIVAIVCCKKLTKFSKNATVQFIGEFSGILKDDLKKVQKCNRPRQFGDNFFPVQKRFFYKKSDYLFSQESTVRESFSNIICPMQSLATIKNLGIKKKRTLSIIAVIPIWKLKYQRLLNVYKRNHKKLRCTIPWGPWAQHTYLL